jgi:RNA polymerase II subunit A C-terminal domain phosphatase
MELMIGMARKSIERLFPVDQSMVAVIDDRGDVWGWQPNLVKVMPYDFFVGIGDINSSFLPKQVDPPFATLSNLQFTPPPTPPPKIPPPKPPTPATEDTSKPPEVPAPESVTSDTPTIDSLVAITQADDPDLIRAQTSEQNAVLEAQQVERPLAAAQSALDAKIEELAASSSESESEDEELYGDK